MNMVPSAKTGLIVVCILASASPISGKNLPPAADLLPPETVFLAEIGDCSKLKDQFEKTSLYKLYKDPSMSEFVENFKDRKDEKVASADSKLLNAIFNEGALPQGRAAVALVLGDEPVDWQQESPFLLMAEWGEHLGTIKAGVAAMTDKSLEEGSRKKVESYRGVDITTVLDPGGITGGEELDPVMRESGVSYCFMDDTLLVGSRLDDIKFTIAAITGSSAAKLSDDSEYKATMRSLGPWHDVDMYVNIKQIIETVTSGPEGAELRTTLENLGFSNVMSFAGSAAVARKSGIGISGKFALRIDGQKKGVCKMLDMPSTPVDLPDFIPADATSVFMLNLDFQKAFQELGNIIVRFSPQYAAILQMPFLPVGEGGAPADIKTAVIDHLGSRILATQDAASTLSAAQPSIFPDGLIMAVEISNRTALERTLSIVHGSMLMPNRPDMRRELLGHTMYFIDPAAMLGAPQPGAGSEPMAAGGVQQMPEMPEMPKLAFTLTDTFFLFGTDISVEKVVRRLTGGSHASMESKDWYKRVRSEIPARVGIAQLSDNAAAWEVLWNQIKSQSAAQPDEDDDSDIEIKVGVGSDMNPATIFLEGLLGELADFSLLPDAEKVKQYFGTSAFYGVSRPDGFFFEFKLVEPTGR